MRNNGKRSDGKERSREGTQREGGWCEPLYPRSRAIPERQEEKAKPQYFLTESHRYLGTGVIRAGRSAGVLPEIRW